MVQKCEKLCAQSILRKVLQSYYEASNYSLVGVVSFSRRLMFIYLW